MTAHAEEFGFTLENMGNLGSWMAISGPKPCMAARRLSHVLGLANFESEIAKREVTVLANSNKVGRIMFTCDRVLVEASLLEWYRESKRDR